MTLAPVEGKPGLWRDPDWTSTGGGTFAVIIGVSRYDHLAGGKDPATDTYGLDQLAVSALTAWRVFDWLRGAYRMAEAPVAEVRLLLAPTPEEIAFAPALAEHRAEPDFQGCELAINAWYNAMAALPMTAAAASRAVFFFSGHGLELTQDQQILLPSDYLRPDLPNVNRALSSSNLRKGLAGLAVWRQFYFLDACRNDHHRLRDQGVVGTAVLSEPSAAKTNLDLIAPVLHATATGAQAFQRKTPGEGLSLFGEALLDGLAGKPGLALRRLDEAQAAIDIFPLQQFVKTRVRALLRLDPNNPKQPVRLSGVIDDGPVTVISLDWIEREREEREERNRIEREEWWEERAELPPEASRPRAASAASLVLGAPAVLLGAASAAFALGAPAVLVLGASAALAVGASAALTLWSRVRLLRRERREAGERAARERERLIIVRRQTFEPVDPEHLALRAMSWPDGAWPPPAEALSRCEGLRLRKDLLVRIAFHKPYGGRWIEVAGSGGALHGALLPAANAVFRLALDYDPEGPAGLAAVLDPETPDANLRGAAKVWEFYQQGDLGEAIEAARALDLENLLRDKVNSPLAAAIAALLLIRVRRFDLLHHWTRNLSDWFSNLPDGAVIRAIHCLRVPGDNREAAVSEAAENLARLAERGTPYLAETFAYACGATETLAREETLDPAMRERLGLLAAELGTLRAYHRPHGLFTAFSFPNRAAAALLDPAIGTDP